MKTTIKIIVIVLLFSGINLLPSSCAAIETEQLVDNFAAATDLQKTALTKEYQGAELKGNGRVGEVKEYDMFDERTDTRGKYYAVITKVENTVKGNPYRILFFYKDKSKTENIDKGQAIERSGKILKVDYSESLWLSIWLYEDEIGPEEKVMFQIQ